MKFLKSLEEKNTQIALLKTFLEFHKFEIEVVRWKGSGKKTSSERQLVESFCNCNCFWGSSLLSRPFHVTCIIDSCFFLCRCLISKPTLLMETAHKQSMIFLVAGQKVIRFLLQSLFSIIRSSFQSKFYCYSISINHSNKGEKRTIFTSHIVKVSQVLKLWCA